MAVAMGADDLKSRTQVLKYSVQSQRVKESKSQPLPAPPSPKKHLQLACPKLLIPVRVQYSFQEHSVESASSQMSIWD